MLFAEIYIKFPTFIRKQILFFKIILVVIQNDSVMFSVRKLCCAQKKFTAIVASFRKHYSESFFFFKFLFLELFCA